MRSFNLSDLAVRQRAMRIKAKGNRSPFGQSCAFQIALRPLSCSHEHSERD
jgi:hypothetical protein